jgi:DNA-binding transcriptional MerR regulator
MFSTGEVAVRLGTRESVLQDLVRRGLVPVPRIAAGRRLWTDDGIEAARGVLLDRLRRRVRRADVGTEAFRVALRDLRQVEEAAGTQREAERS